VQGERALEYRFVLDRAVAEGVLRRAAGHLTPDVHAPGRPVTYCRTLYLDTDDGALLRTFRRGATACRMRLRQYAAASDLAGEPIVASRRAFVEVKRSCGLERAKVRIPVALERVDAVLAGLAGNGLRPRLLTWFRRWSLGRAPVRITLDEGIAYCRPEPPAAAGERAAPRAVIARDGPVILEVKVTRAMPGWLEQEVAGLGPHLALRHSKFRAGMDALRRESRSSGGNDEEWRDAG
jgi:hypothetical protein